MGILKFFLKIIVPILLLSIIFLVSIFLNPKLNIVFIALILLILIFIFIAGLTGVIRNRKSNSAAASKFSNICLTAAILVVCIFRIEGKEITILNNSNRSASVYSIIKSNIDSKKESEAYNKLFKIEKHNNAEIYYKEDVEPALGLINQYLDKADLETSKIFGKINDVPLTIKLDYDEGVFKSLKKGAAYDGLYNPVDNKIDILVKDCYIDVLGLTLKSTDFKHNMFHEYSHYKLDEFLSSNNIEGSSVPVWFNEGLAEYIAYGGGDGGDPQNIVDFNKLNDVKSWDKYVSENYTVYEQAHYAVSRLIALKGEKVVQQILLKTKGSNFETAFEAVAGESLLGYQKQLQDDMNNGWKQYHKMIKPISPAKEDNTARINGLLAYADKHTDKADALLDAEQLYENLKQNDKAKEICELAVKRNPNNSLAWARLGGISVELSDFETAEKAYEKSINLDKNNSAGYLNLAQALLAADINKAAETAKQAVKVDKSRFAAKQVQQIENLKTAADKGNPYPAALSMIKSDSIISNTLKRAFIDKLIRDFPNVKNSSRSELERIYKK